MYICWISGIIIYFMLMIIGFIGYILPFGQMSYWGATVIFNIISIELQLFYLLLKNPFPNISHDLGLR